MPRLIESNIDIEDERAPCLVAKLKCLLSKYDIYTVFVGIFDDCFFITEANSVKQILL